jgi:hypothetical protein
MKTLGSSTIALSSILFSFVSSTRADTSGAAAHRGVVEVTGRAAKIVTVGPALLHSYSGFAGGAIFVIRAIAGTDAGCAAALAPPSAAHPIALVPDVVTTVQLGVGEAACLVTETDGSFELLWHAFARGD